MGVEDYAYFLEYPKHPEVAGWTTEVWHPHYETENGRTYVMDEEGGGRTPVDCLIALTPEEYHWMHYEDINPRTPAIFEGEYNRVVHLLSEDHDEFELSHLRKSVAWSVRLGGSTEEYFKMFYGNI